MEEENKNIKLSEETPQGGTSASPEDGKIAEAGSGDLMDSVKNFLDFSFETIRVVIVSLIIIFVVRSFIIQPFFVKGSSMVPNFQDGDYLIVDELSYEVGQPQRGEVVVFKYPKDPTQFFIKRVIGLPGETVQIQNSKITIYNDQHLEGFGLDESLYLDKEVTTSGSVYQVLGPDEYYVLGDNRAASSDSRVWGVLGRSYIIGKAWVRAWPFNSFEVFDEASYKY